VKKWQSTGFSILVRKLFFFEGAQLLDDDRSKKLSLLLLSLIIYSEQVVFYAIALIFVSIFFSGTELMDSILGGFYSLMFYFSLHQLR